MKKSFTYHFLVIAGWCVFFFGCITPYVHDEIESSSQVLIVDGVIANDTSLFTLSWSMNLNDEYHKTESIDNAEIVVECNDGSRSSQTIYKGEGIYHILTGKLEKGKQYRVRIFAGGKEYESEFLEPLFTPDIDSVSWQQQRKGEPIRITVSTHDPENKSPYYNWSYKEIWEFKSELLATGTKIPTYINGILYEVPFEYDLLTSNNTYYCWSNDSSKTYILENTEKLQENIISHKTLSVINPSDERISLLYYIEVKQNQIRKEAYTYYSNIQKNIENTGSIFAPIPGEIKGNIRCVTNDKTLAVGYVEVSTVSVAKCFFPELTKIYEPTLTACGQSIIHGVAKLIDGYEWLTVTIHGSENSMAPANCVDCTRRGTKNKPSFWPTEHL